MSASKARGTAFETAVVRFLQKWFPRAERRALSGIGDKGDINLGPPVVLECKDHGRLEFSVWLTEAEIERKNAGAEFGFVIAKRRGKGAKDAYAVCSLETLAVILGRLYG